MFLFLWTMAFNLLHQNIQGLSTHGQEFKFYVSTYSSPPDVICLQETFLKPHLDFTFYGYSVQRQDRIIRNRGGLCMFLKNGLSYSEVKLPDFISIEAQCFNVATRDGKLVSIVNIYNPNNRLDMNDFTRLMGLCNNSCVLCGDFNAHNTLWGSGATDFNGRVVAEVIQEYDLFLLNDGAGTRLDPHT